MCVIMCLDELERSKLERVCLIRMIYMLFIAISNKIVQVKGHLHEWTSQVWLPLLEFYTTLSTL